MIRWLVALAALWLAAPAVAHDALPVVLSLDQVGAHEYSLRAHFPPAFAEGRAPRVDVAGRCRVARRQGDTMAIRCPDAAPPAALTLAYPGPSGSVPIVLRLAYASGERRTAAAPPGTTRIELPRGNAPSRVFPGYFVAGLRHIAGGLDHLLFLACLMLIARSPRRIVLTVTGFTLGHALTLSLATLNLVRVPSGAVEVLIALSIVFVAAEIARDRRTTLTWRWPALVATLFGLLHGLGFAGALREIGLPFGQVPMALVAFNLGIETGQLAFVLAVLTLVLASRRHLARLWDQPAIAGSRAIAWPIGLIAGVWLFERASAL